jgi:hypothetical protein
MSWFDAMILEFDANPRIWLILSRKTFRTALEINNQLHGTIRPELTACRDSNNSTIVKIPTAFLTQK